MVSIGQRASTPISISSTSSQDRAEIASGPLTTAELRDYLALNSVYIRLARVEHEVARLWAIHGGELAILLGQNLIIAEMHEKIHEDMVSELKRRGG